MKKFNYYLPVNLVFGRGEVERVGALAAPYGKKVFLVTGRSSTKKTGLLSRVQKILEQQGLSVVVFDQVQQNPLTTTAEEGAALARSQGCDVVVGLGGGSIMDCAKAIAFLCVNHGDINDYIFNRLPSKDALPLFLIPTTCGTGSEGNGFAVLTNPETGDKKSLRSNAIIPKASIIDSELMETMPKSVLASVGFDALCHSMEAYLSKLAQPMTDLLCLEAMNNVGKYLVPLYQGQGDAESWDGLTWASTIGGMVINTAGVALPHGMEHPASGCKDLVHGKGLAALTPVITEASIDGAPERYATISRALGGVDEKDCALQIRKLLAALDLNITLGDQGITEGDIPWMTENCLKVSAASIANHPKTFNAEEIAELYRRAL
jgi:alcohol dehydrogenase class IV